MYTEIVQQESFDATLFFFQKSGRMELMSDFYLELAKPFFAPPGWLFGPVWGFLYLLILISFGWVVWQVGQKKFSPKLLWPLGINLASNLSWTYFFFELRNFDLALLDIFIVWGSILWIMHMMWRRKPWVSWIQIPYLLWVSFAAVLMVSIWWMN